MNVIYRINLQLCLWTHLILAQRLKEYQFCLDFKQFSFNHSKDFPILVGIGQKFPNQLRNAIVLPYWFFFRSNSLRSCTFLSTKCSWLDPARLFKYTTRTHSLSEIGQYTKHHTWIYYICFKNIGIWPETPSRRPITQGNERINYIFHTLSPHR